MKNKKLSINDLDALIFDFDGVLTDNKVHLDQDGNEWVSCNRSDGLAFDVLRKFKKHTYIISTEKNKVVAARAKKLKIPVLFGVQSKSDALKKLSKKKLFNLDRTLYVGNDLNDYEALIYVVTQHALLIAIKRLKKFQHLNLTLKVDWV